MAHSAFSRADTGFLQAYLLCLDRRRNDSALWGAAPPAAEDLWRRLDAGGDRDRDRIRDAHAAVCARIAAALDADAATWVGTAAERAESGRVRAGMAETVAELHDRGDARLADVRPPRPRAR